MEQDQKMTDVEQQIEEELRKLEEESLALERQLKEAEEAEQRAKQEEKKKLAEENAIRVIEEQRKQLEEQSLKEQQEAKAASEKTKKISLMSVITAFVVLVVLLMIPESFNIWHKAMSLFVVVFMIVAAIAGYKINNLIGAGVCFLIAGLAASLVEVVIGLEVMIKLLVLAGLIFVIFYFGMRYLKS